MNYEPIFPGGIVLSLLTAGGCGGQVTQTDAALVQCRSAYPKVPACGSIGRANAPIDDISVVYVRGDGADFLVGYTGPDCASGDGFYADAALDELVLCPTTCSKVVADSGGSVMAYPNHCSAPLCIN
jgi:hypothetical protein